ncbi:MAG TPA: hypothetical protein VJ184_06500 [Chryseolinea sp.]|nr:hypothetical protein [Chryseolinea sp.]
METKQIADSRVGLLITLYDMHTTFYSNVIDGISDKDAHNRLNTKANHVAWIAGSIVHERFELAYAIGVNKKDISENRASSGLFKDHQGIQDNVSYPSLADYRKDWGLITPVLRDQLLSLSDDQLNGPDPFEMPGENTLFDAITFLIDRESYCIGQIGLYRRLLGYEAMKYQ